DRCENPLPSGILLPQVAEIQSSVSRWSAAPSIRKIMKTQGRPFLVLRVFAGSLVAGMLRRVDMRVPQRHTRTSPLPGPARIPRRSQQRAHEGGVRNCGYMLPKQHITINLAPADVKKEEVNEVCFGFRSERKVLNKGGPLGPA